MEFKDETPPDQMNDEMNSPRNDHMMTSPNHFNLMSQQNYFLMQNMTNHMGNLQISHNMEHYKNENINMNQNQLEEKKKFTSFIVFFLGPSSGQHSSIMIETDIDEKISILIEKYRKKSGDYDFSKKFIYNAKDLDINMTCGEAGLVELAKIFVKNTKGIKGAGYWYSKEINIKFILVSKNVLNKNDNIEIIGLLKLCLLKEISQKISEDKLKALPDIVYYILKILSNGYIADNPNDIKTNIREILEKSKGSNIITFSNYVDEMIDSQLINKILNLLEKKDNKEMNNLKNLLSNYNNCIKFFNKEFIQAQKESILEFSIISLVIIEREDFEKFEQEREKCPNRVEKILYHGTSIEPASNILTGLYKKSLERKKAINGKGVYFTDLLDYAWYYGSEEGNRANFSGVPKINDTFTIIMNYIL